MCYGLYEYCFDNLWGLVSDISVDLNCSARIEIYKKKYLLVDFDSKELKIGARFDNNIVGIVKAYKWLKKLYGEYGKKNNS